MPSAIIHLACCVCVLVSVSSAEGKQPFCGVPTSHPYYNYIQYMYDRDITLGYAESCSQGGAGNRFGPDENIKRSQVSAFIVRAVLWSMSGKANGVTPDGMEGFVTNLDVPYFETDSYNGAPDVLFNYINTCKSLAGCV